MKPLTNQPVLFTVRASLQNDIYDLYCSSEEDTKLIKLVQEGMNTSYFNSCPLSSSELCLIDSANKIREAIPLSSQETKPKEL